MVSLAYHITGDTVKKKKNHQQMINYVREQNSVW